MNFTNVTDIRIPQGEVIRIQDSTSRVLWEKKNPLYLEPFYVKDVSGEANTVTIYRSDGASPSLDVEYSMDGSTWYNAGNTGNTGGIQVQLPANGKMYLRCLTNNWAKQSGAGNQGYNYINAWKSYEVGGNIMSLLMGSSFDGSTGLTSSNASAFRHLFGGYVNNITSANKLILNTTLAEDCYYGMFNGCTALIDAPSLPATTLANYCYDNMFEGCTSLTTAPELPATTLTTYCYCNMFYNCTSLTTAPELPATTLARECYSGMFQGCTSLTTAPELPATTLTTYCYRNMFEGCTSLTTAPELPATILTTYCYGGMFIDCTNLNYIKCLATDMSAYSCIGLWVRGVAASGTFYKKAGVEWSTGESGIPEGWTVVEV